MADGIVIKKNYKDSIFRFVFSNLHSYFINLYNAVSGNNYPEDTEIINRTLENILISGIKNDIAYSIGDKIVVLMEHQSTVNENMPLRMMLYLSRIYEQIIDSDNLYHSKRISLPSPEFYVIYNGRTPLEDKTLVLSDSFNVLKERVFIEVKVNVVNINYSEDREILKKSFAAREYSHFLHVFEQCKLLGYSDSSSFHQALDSCLEPDFKELLNGSRQEVINMLFQEWDFDKALAVRGQEERDEGIAIGRKIGFEEGIEKGIKKGIEKGIDNIIISMLSRMAPENIAEIINVPIDRVLKVAASIN